MSLPLAALLWFYVSLELQYTWNIVLIICLPISTVLNDVYGRHPWDFPVSDLTDYYVKVRLEVNNIPHSLQTLTERIKQNQISQACLYDVASIFTKSSLLVLYLRNFQPSRRARFLIWLGIICLVVFYLVCLISKLVLCLPHSNEQGSWARLVQEPRCNHPLIRLNTAQGVFSVLTDFYALAIPLSLVWRLQLSTARKAGVSAIFLTGLM